MKVRCRNAATSLLLSAFLTSCGEEPSTSGSGPTSSDRDKFVGTWVGVYACPGIPGVADTLRIALGPQMLDFAITIHVGVENPDSVLGELSAPDVIDVPEQSMGGYPGTARITYVRSGLTYLQSGLGITCGGSDYAMVS